MRKTYSIGVDELKTHIEKPRHDNPFAYRQVELLGISRSSLYYQPVPISSFTLSLMHRIDEIYTKRPFYGVRRITEQLRREKILVNHKRVHGLMQNMGIQGLIPKRNLSKNDSPHIKYPYLLRSIPIVRINQVWGTDITYIRMRSGFVYLTVFMDCPGDYQQRWREHFVLMRQMKQWSFLDSRRL